MRARSGECPPHHVRQRQAADSQLSQSERKILSGKFVVGAGPVLSPLSWRCPAPGGPVGSGVRFSGFSLRRGRGSHHGVSHRLPLRREPGHGWVDDSVRGVRCMAAWRLCGAVPQGRYARALFLREVPTRSTAFTRMRASVGLRWSWRGRPASRGARATARTSVCAAAEEKSKQRRSSGRVPRLRWRSRVFGTRAAQDRR